MKNLFSILPLLFLFASCQTGENTKQELNIEEDFQTVEIKDYRLKLPNYMDEMMDMNEDASMGYGDVNNELYVIVIDESYAEINTVLKKYNETEKDASFTDYVQLYWNMVDESMEITSKDEISTTRINGIKAKMFGATGTIEDVNDPLYYHYVFFEGADRYYFVMIWTLESRKEDHLATIDQIVKSFELVK